MTEEELIKYGAIEIPPRDRLEELLRKHDLRVSYYEMFCRWHFQLNDKDGKLLWHMKDFDLKKIQKSLLDYLENYDSKGTKGN
jgi:hypothetical protein